MVESLSLKQLLAEVDGVLGEDKFSEEKWNTCAGELRLDSRQVSRGDTFVAVKGYQLDGRQFIEQAINAGATLVLAESADRESYIEFEQSTAVAIIWIENLSGQLSLIAANYYQHPSQYLKVIAVTGTNGKTSCSYIIARALQRMHFECYLLGTLGTGSCGQLTTSNNTTVDAISMQKILHSAVDSGAQFASMEISSHGLDQGRAAAVQIRSAIFTNLTHDHLDYHGSMENYGSAKRKLFLQPNLKHAVINVDDKFGKKLAKDAEIIANKWLVSTQPPLSGASLDNWIWAEDVMYSDKGIHATIYSPWGKGKLDSPLMGQFNLSNLLLVIAALGPLLNELEPVLKALSEVHAAPGRMEKIWNKNKPTVIVDYAHTPDALEQTLLAIREHNVGLIWCVFGCGGDRDVSKRSLMAGIAEKFANRVIVTQDNPRTEAEENIRQDIFSGFRKPEKVEYISDRRQAIEKAISNAQAGDVVLIAGKGHEDYQIIGDQKLNFSDLAIAKECLEGGNE